MRMINIVGIILIAFFLIGCAEVVEESTEVDSDDEGYDTADFDDEFYANSDESNVKKVEGTSETKSGDCEAAWRCISNSKMVYQNSDCSFGEKKDCSTLCENDTCRPAKVCDVGFKCYNKDTTGYQKEDCSWIKKKLCEAGCVDDDCVEVDENATVDKTDEGDTSEGDDNEESSTPVVNFEQLNIGEEITLEDMPVSLYIIESDRVKITIDGKNSNWLAEGESFSRNGL